MHDRTTKHIWSVNSFNPSKLIVSIRSCSTFQKRLWIWLWLPFVSYLIVRWVWGWKEEEKHWGGHHEEPSNWSKGQKELMIKLNFAASQHQSFLFLSLALLQLSERGHSSKIIDLICSVVLLPRWNPTTVFCKIVPFKIDLLYSRSKKMSTKETFSLVCYTAVFSVVTQRSSPLAAAENRITFLSFCVCGLTNKTIMYKKLDNTWAARRYERTRFSVFDKSINRRWILCLQATKRLIAEEFVLSG